MSSSLPRRSARLAAKYGKPQEPQQSTPSSLDVSRSLFLNYLNKSFNDSYYEIHSAVRIIKQYLTDIEDAPNKLSKTVLATALFHFLIQRPVTMAVHPNFLDTVRRKIAEMKTQALTLPDTPIRTAFEKALADIAYVIGESS